MVIFAKNHNLFLVNVYNAKLLIIYFKMCKRISFRNLILSCISFLLGHFVGKVGYWPTCCHLDPEEGSLTCGHNSNGCVCVRLRISA